jgi:hypothetical protein
MALRIEVFSTQRDEFGEGALWAPDGERLY